VGRFQNGLNDNFSLANMSKEVETMKKFLMAVAVLCLGTMAFAGPNANGTIFAHDANLLISATDGAVSICGQGLVPATCDDADLEIDGAIADDASIFKVYAAFPDGSAPLLMGITWGVSYDDTNLILPLYGKCGDFELNDDGWPAPGKGSSVTWNTVQTGHLTPVYWFAAYTYGAPGTFNLGPNPAQGGVFGDDTVPAILDPIAAYGILGFDMPGEPACPGVGPVFIACCDPAGVCTMVPEAECLPPNVPMPGLTCDPNPCYIPPVPGACCDPATGLCTLVIETECLAPLVWNGGPTCDPNPCPPPPVPVQNGTWGSIKANYR